MEQAQVKNLFEFLDSGIVSSNDFANRVVRSGLISREDVEQTWAELAEPMRTPSGLANELASRFRLLPSQAAVLVESADLPLVLGNYVIEGKLGQGGMGTVYHAVHRKMKREVALKVIALNSETLIRRFEREVELISRLSHPNIVVAHDAGDSQGVHYLVMERVHGIDLGSLVETNGPVPLAKALDLVRQAARGLAYAHAQGIVHRDVKPSNLLLDNQGIVKVLDLGIARLDGTNDDLSSIYGMTHTGMMMGTVDYMSPEQAMDAKSANAQSDIYSLGCTLFFLATGRSMYDGDTAMKRIFAHREEPTPQLSAYLASSNSDHKAVDDSQRIFEQMVAKLPAERFAGMNDVVGALDRFLDNIESIPSLQLPAKIADRVTRDLTEVPTATTDTEVPIKAAIVPSVSKHLVPIDPLRKSQATKVNAKVVGVGAGLLIVAFVAFAMMNRSEPQSDNTPGSDKIDSASVAFGNAEALPPASPLVAYESSPLPTESSEVNSLSPMVPKIDESQSNELPIENADVSTARAEQGEGNTFTNSVGMKFVKIPAGTFMMGSPETDTEAESNEKPQHQVTLTRSFYMGETEVTQGQWKSVMGTEPWKGESLVREGANYPATYVSWDEAVEYCRRLSDREGRQYRLPTEAEWEYACRGGTNTKYSFGDDASLLSQYGWFRENAADIDEGYAHLVQQKVANPFGLYDMHGNVWEWCSDCYGAYTTGAATDPIGPVGGANRVSRGGSWFTVAARCRSAYRSTSAPSYRGTFYGLRLALSPSIQETAEPGQGK